MLSYANDDYKADDISEYPSLRSMELSPESANGN